MDVDEADELLVLLNGPSLLDTYKNLGGKKVNVVGKFQITGTVIKFCGASSIFKWDFNKIKYADDLLRDWDPKSRFWKCKKEGSKTAIPRWCESRLEFVLNEEERDLLVGKLRALVKDSKEFSFEGEFFILLIFTN